MQHSITLNPLQRRATIRSFNPKRQIIPVLQGDLGDAKPDWDANPENRHNADANWAKGDLDKAV